MITRLSELIGNNVWIIAEIGINHEGCFDTCKKLIKVAADAGANAVKLQTIDPDLNYSSETESYKLFSKAKLTIDQTGQIFEYARKLGVEPFTTVGDVYTLREIQKFKPNCYKVSSGLLTCSPLINEIVKLGKPVIFSAGMTDFNITREALDSIVKEKNDSVAILHCVSRYPPRLDETNLSQINFLKHEFSCTTGYSDHSGIPSMAGKAVLAGAEIIECHITLDKNRLDFDHKVSLNATEFKEMVSGVRDAECVRGSVEFIRSPEIQEVSRKMGRYLATIKAVKKGEMLSLENVGFLRFENSEGLLPAKHFNQLLNKKFIRSMKPFSPVFPEDLSNA